MSLQLNLEKAEEQLRLDLSKAGITEIPEMELAFDLDVSWSFKDEHDDGLTNALLMRLVPWGMVFDPDKQIDVFTFSDGRNHAHHVGMVKPENCEGYVERHIIGKVPGYKGGTDYSYVLRMNLEHFGWLEPEPTRRQVTTRPKKKRGFWKSLFCSGEIQEPVVQEVEVAQEVENDEPQRPSLILHVTDGDNSDKGPTREVLKEAQRSGAKVYYLFLGVSNQNVSFRFLRDIAKEFANVGFVEIKDVHEWVKLSDEKINEQLITDGLVKWMKAAV